MNIIIAETEINDIVTKYINNIRDKSRAEVNMISNPMETNVYSFKKDNKQYTVLGFDLKIFPVYYLLLVLLVLFFIFPNWFTGVLTCLIGLFTIPFTNVFWKLMYRKGIRKQGYTGKIAFLDSSKVLGVLLWDK